MNNVARRAGSPLSTARSSSIEDQFGKLVENMFEDFITPFGPYSSLVSRRDGGAMVSPRLNVIETEKTFEVEAELPGVKKEDIKVAIANQRVTIEGESKQESAQKEGENIVYAERSTRKFARSFILPTEVDDAGAQAKLENGILLLTLPKKQSDQTKTLTIQ